MPPRTRGLFEDIRDSIGYIADDTAGLTVEEFVADRRARQLVAHNFEIIGEAMYRLRRDNPSTVQFISGHNQIIGMRNTLIHRYDAIDYPVVWKAIHESLPQLAKEINELLLRASL